MPAILFGSISSIADTSELQRRAFNDAFAQHGLDWTWEREEYQALLVSNGGRDRIAQYAKDRGETVDAEAVHDTKSRLFRESMTPASVALRAGVRDTARDAKAAGWQLGLVTTTSRENVDKLLEVLPEGLHRDDFAVVVDAGDVENVKPDPEAYTHALAELGDPAAQCVAIEDNVGGVKAARAADIACVAFANENTAGHDFGEAPRVTRLEFAALTELAGGTSS